MRKNEKVATMRIVAVGDMHGSLQAVFTAVETAKPDLLLSSGDWGDPGQLDPEEFRSLVEKVRVLTVFGNHDDIVLLSTTANTDGSPVLLSQGEVREVGGLRLAGISGIWAKSHRIPYYITDEDAAKFANEIRRHGDIDIMLTHGCPVGLADATPAGRHGGQRCFLDAFHAVRPRLYICGHLHLAQQRILKDGRTVVNVGYTFEGDYWIIEMDRIHIRLEHCNTTSGQEG